MSDMETALLEIFESSGGATMPGPELLTPEQFADRLKVSRRTVYRWLKADTVPGAVQYGSLWRIPETAIEEMAKKKAPDSGAASTSS